MRTKIRKNAGKLLNLHQNLALFMKLGNRVSTIPFISAGKAAIKRVQRELAHFVEREQARTSFKSQ